MSLGDELRYLRARHGGPSYLEIEEATGIPTATLRDLEQRYRRVGEDDQVLARLAAYYGVELEELQFHRERYRKALSAVLLQSLEEGGVFDFELRDGQTLSGKVRWWDLGAFGLDTGDGEIIVVQRHAVIDWRKVNDR